MPMRKKFPPRPAHAVQPAHMRERWMAMPPKLPGVHFTAAEHDVHVAGAEEMEEDLAPDVGVKRGEEP